MRGVFISLNNKRTSPSTYPPQSATYAQHATRPSTSPFDTPLTVNIFSTTIFAEPELLELVPTLTGESNFTSWSTTLKCALDTRDPIFSRPLLAVRPVLTQLTPTPTPTLTLPSQLTWSTFRLLPATPPCASTIYSITSQRSDVFNLDFQ
ncbi:hypothetical protein N7527_010396 [Penicillium freii]|nr:hypothetical protein N7527_010396 [Penicillium freii]